MADVKGSVVAQFRAGKSAASVARQRALSSVLPQRPNGLWSPGRVRVSSVIERFVDQRYNRLQTYVLQPSDPTRPSIRLPQNFTIPDLQIVVQKPQPTTASESPNVLWSHIPQAADRAQMILSKSFGEEAQFSATRQIHRDDLFDALNAAVRQEAHVRALVEGVKPGETVVVPRDDPVDMQLVIQSLPARSFAARALSPPERFDFNMERLRRRTFSRSTIVLDFSPSSAQSMRVMDLPVADLRQWQALSRQLTRASKESNKAVSFSQPSLTQLFFVLRTFESSATILIYGHSDGEAIYLDTGAGGVVRLTASMLRKEFGEWGDTWLPTIALLNCSAQGTLSDAFLDAGAPTVFSTRMPITLKDAARFAREHIRATRRMDAVDALFETTKKVRITHMGPSSD